MKDQYNRGFERLIGKKIVHIDTSAVNCVMIETEDGERLVIDTISSGLYGLKSPVVCDIAGYDFK